MWYSNEPNTAFPVLHEDNQCISTKPAIPTYYNYSWSFGGVRGRMGAVRGGQECLSEINKNPKQVSCLGVAWNVFHPYIKRQYSKSTHILLTFFGLRGTEKAPVVVLLRPNNTRGTKTAFLTPKRYDGHPPSFLYRSPLPHFPGLAEGKGNSSQLRKGVISQKFDP